MSESEIARLRTRLEQEHAASVQALTGLTSGAAQHAFISARLRRMDIYYQRLSELIGSEQATNLLCKIFDGEKGQDAKDPEKGADMMDERVRSCLPTMPEKR